MIRATITYKDGKQEVKPFDTFPALAEWMRLHWGTYEEVDGKEIAPDEIRQGRE